MKLLQIFLIISGLVPLVAPAEPEHPISPVLRLGMARAEVLDGWSTAVREDRKDGTLVLFTSVLGRTPTAQVTMTFVDDRAVLIVAEYSAVFPRRSERLEAFRAFRRDIQALGGTREAALRLDGIDLLTEPRHEVQYRELSCMEYASVHEGSRYVLRLSAPTVDEMLSNGVLTLRIEPASVEGGGQSSSGSPPP